MSRFSIVIFLGFSSWAALQIHAASADGWRTAGPRAEILPQFQHEETGGKSGHGALTIRADEREGLHGWWQKTFSATGGRYYRWLAAVGVHLRRRPVGAHFFTIGLNSERNTEPSVEPIDSARSRVSH
jgi:hypothetical protein